MRARIVTIAVAAASFMLSEPLTEVAAGEVRPPSGTGGYIDDRGDPTAIATDPAATPVGGGGRGGRGPAPPCTPWEVAVEDDFEFPIYDAEAGERMYSETGRWLTRTCLMEGPDGDVIQVYENRPEGDQVDPAELALQALRSVSVPEPVIGTSPPADALVVQVPTWLWVDGGWWQGYEATASAGRVTSTVTVEPIEASWSMGDGSTVTCSGPGVEWTRGLPEDATDCSYIYTSTSDRESGGVFNVEVTIGLQVSWSSNSGAAGVLPGVARTASRTVRVGEIQAIETE